jgi:hypothetical protein
VCGINVGVVGGTPAPYVMDLPCFSRVRGQGSTQQGVHTQKASATHLFVTTSIKFHGFCFEIICSFSVFYHTQSTIGKYLNYNVLPPYLMFDFFSINFDSSFYSKYFIFFEKIKYIHKMHYVINHTIVKTKNIFDF